MKRVFFLLIFLFTSNWSYGSSVELFQKISPWISFEISAATESFLIALEHTQQKNVIFADLIDPDGRVLIKSNIGTPSEARIPPDIHSSFTSLIRTSYSSHGLAGVLVSNRADELTGPVIKAGTWKMRLAYPSFKTAEKIMVNYDITEKGAISVSDLHAQFDVVYDHKIFSDKKMEEILGAVTDIYQKGKIKLQFNNINRSFNTSEKSQSLDELINHLQNTKSKLPVIYLVDHQGEHNKDFQGFAGCLPGFIPQHLDKHCGLIIRVNMNQELNLAKMSKVIAHELGHFFGLFHLQDDYYPFGKLNDPIADTDITTEETNIMHKTSDVFEVLEFTEGQFQVMRRHPLLKIR